MILNLPKLGLVRFDDNLTSEELSQQLTALSQKYGFQFEQPERGLSTLFGEGVIRGAKQMGSALFDVIPALGASALGFDKYAKKQMQEAAETQAEIERNYPAQFKSYTEVGSPYEALQYGAETFGELVPTALGTLIPGGIAGGVGRAAATRGAMAAAESVGPLSLAGREAARLAAEKAGATAGKYAGYAGAYLGSYAQNTPEIFQNIYEETGGKFEPMVAALAGGLSSILDSFVPGKLLEKLGPAGRIQAVAAMARDSGAAPSVWKAIAKEASKAAVAEGLTESAQEAISVAAEEVAGSLKGLLSPESIQRYKESFVKGAVGGVGFGTIGGVRRGFVERDEYKKKFGVEPPAAPTEETAAPAAPTEETAAPPAAPTEEAAAPPAAPTNIVDFIEELNKRAETEVDQGAAPKVTPPKETAPAPAPVTLETVTKIDDPAAFGKLLGIGRTALILKPDGPLAGLDVSTPEGAAAAKQVLEAYAGGNRSGKIATAVSNYITTRLDPVIAKGAPNVAGIDTTTGGEGVGVSGEGVGRTAPAPVEPVERGGVDVATGDVGQPAVGKAEEPGALAPEVQRAADFVQSVEAGGIPLNPAKIRAIAEDLGLEVKKSARPEETIQRIREAVERAKENVRVDAAPETKKAPQGEEEFWDELFGGTRAESPPVGEPTPAPTEAAPAPAAPQAAETQAAPEPAAPEAPTSAPKVSPEVRKTVKRIDREVNSLLSSRVKEMLEDAGEDPAIFKIGSFDGTETHDALRLPRLFSEYITLAQKVGTQYEGAARQQMAEIKAVASQIDPDSATIFDQLAQSGTQQNAVLGMLNRNALSKFESVMGEAIKEVKAARAEEAQAADKRVAKEAPKRQRRETKLTKAEEARVDAVLDQIFGTGGKPLPAPSVTAGVPFTPEQRSLADAGDLLGLLRSVLAQVKDPTTKRILERIIGLRSDTKLVIGPTLDGSSGSFDPATNTITLDPEAGLNTHTLMHEGSHGVLSHTLDNENHPITKEVTKLFNDMKGSIDGTYGATNVQEFAAEAWSNEEFRNRLREFKPDGQKLNGLKRLINSVRRLFKFSPSYETAFDRLDKMLDQIMSPAPETRAGETLYAHSIRVPDVAGKIYHGLDNVLRKIPSVITPERRTQMWSMLEKLAVPMRSVVYKALSASQLGEVATKYFGEDSVKFARLLNEMEGYKEVLREKLEPLHNRNTEYRNSNPERHEVLSKLMTDATVANVAPYSVGVDPTTGAVLVPKKYAGTNKEQTWRDLNGRFMELSKEEQQLYRDNFEAFIATREEFKNSLRLNIRELVGDKDRALSVYNKLMLELSEVMIDHYFPLYREPTGYRLSYNIKGVPEVQRFETQAERSAAQEKLAAEGATDFNATSQIDQYTARSVPDGTMLASIVKIMKDAGAQEADLDKLIQLVVSAFPEASILKTQQRRTGIGGYINDTALVFDRVMSNTVRQIANTRYRQQIKNVLADMEKTQKGLEGDASEDAKTLFNDFNGRFDFATNPNIAGWAQFMSSSAFYWNLAGNISSALIQLATLPTIVFPMIGGKYGYGKAWGMIKKTLGLYSSSGFSREVEEIGGKKSKLQAMLSIENLVNMGKNPEYKELIDALKGYGLLTNSTARDALYSENQNDSGFGGVNKLQRVTSLYSSFLFHHMERMSREVTAVSAYELELARLKDPSKTTAKEKAYTPQEQQQAAINEAIRITERTHGASSTITGPALGQSDIGKVLMVFKRFAFAQYYNLFGTIFRAFPVKGADAATLEDIKAARRQLVGMYGMAAVFAGAKGIPLYWVAELAYNALRDDDDDDFDALMRKYLGDFFYKGPVNYLTKLSIADRVGWSDLIWRENKGDRSSASAVTQYFETLLGAPFSIVKNFGKGFDQIADGHFYRGVETMLPAAFKNVMKGARYGYEGANTLRGDPVMGDISGYNAAMQVLGFAPADLIKQYEENSYIIGKQDAIMNKEKRLMKQYYVAVRQNDFDRANDLREKLFELNDKYPELQINDASLNKRVQARDRVSDKMYHGVQLNDKLRARLEGAKSIVYD